jgi:hypothetical protein
MWRSGDGMEGILMGCIYIGLAAPHAKNSCNSLRLLILDSSTSKDSEMTLLKPKYIIPFAILLT